MKELIFPDFYETHPELKHDSYDFTNDDETLKSAVDKVHQRRKELGIDGMVGDLESIIINVEENRLELAAEEFINSTGYYMYKCYMDNCSRNIVLRKNNSADIILKSRLQGNNAFLNYNIAPKSKDLPNTRLETFVFQCYNLQKYVDIQKGRGVKFLTEYIIDKDNYLFIQTIPSSFTGNSVGFIQWKGSDKNYIDSTDKVFQMENLNHKKDYLNNIGKLDHTATRVKSLHRDSALIEFMELTNYDFKFAIYVDTLNSITNVARLEGAKFAMVFTSGIKPFVNDTSSGPTEKFIQNYGVRVHHLAFETRNIDEVYDSLNKEGYKFMSKVFGSEEKGIKQTFSEPSTFTLLVNEYVCRYGDFQGFFIEENVTKLTKATEKQ